MHALHIIGKQGNCATVFVHRFKFVKRDPNVTIIHPWPESLANKSIYAIKIWHYGNNIP